MKKICFSLSAALLLFSCTKGHYDKNGECTKQSVEVVSKMENQNGGRPLMATLSGAQEVPGPGDPDGTGTAKIYLNQGQGTISFELTVSNIAPATMAHIHRGVAGVSGPVVVDLVAPSSGFSSGTVSVSEALIKEIRQNPSAFYVNVHNAEFRPGAVRGQLSK